MQKRKRPGDPLRERPVQGPNRKWYAYGKRITHTPDKAYAFAFWKRIKKPVRKGVLAAIKENIQTAAKQGMLAINVGAEMDGIAKERLSAYREVAKTIGYTVGKFTHHKQSHSAIAPIMKTK